MPDLHSLTPREREVLYNATRGRSNPEIGRLLVIRKFTVQNHLQHIYRKLDVSSRNEATAICFEYLLHAATQGTSVEELWDRHIADQPPVDQQIVGCELTRKDGCSKSARLSNA